MKHAWRKQAVVMVLSVIAVAACSTTQPTGSSIHTASLSFSAHGLVKAYDCYEVWQDTSNPLDGTPDVFLDQRACFNVPESPEDPFLRSKPVPWHFSLAVTMIRAGTTAEEIVTSVAGVHGTTLDNSETVDDFVSLTEFDPDQPASPVTQPPQGDILLVNGKRVRAGSPVFIGSSSADCQSCPLDLGALNVLGGPPTFDIAVNPGDTIIVRARKQTLQASPGWIQLDPPSNIVLQGTLTVGGTQVVVNGVSDSPQDDGAGFTFSFTVR